ncbi:MAG: hypothetical protein GQ565_06760 [Candidatus Aegiribacteria sp.]|nr:hypothetical protein [Candidatus Aegiribacteria sp.]
MKKELAFPVVFSPDNEPYLGRELLFHFDKMISCCLEMNSEVAPKTHNTNLTDLQKMACQVIPQSISIALSIRELVRQGYLFGGHVLIRSFVERVMILMYLHSKPEKIELWKNGWKHKEAPSLVLTPVKVSSQTGHCFQSSRRSYVYKINFGFPVNNLRKISHFSGTVH